MFNHHCLRQSYLEVVNLAFEVVPKVRHLTVEQRDPHGANQHNDTAAYCGHNWEGFRLHCKCTCFSRN